MGQGRTKKARHLSTRSSPLWAWSPSTLDQARKAKADLGGNRVESALQARFSTDCGKAGSKGGSIRPWFLVAPPSHQHSSGSRQWCVRKQQQGLWSFCQISLQEQGEKGPKPAVVLRSPQGDIASSSADLAKLWQDTFFREIDRRGEIIPKCAYVPFASQMLDTTTPPPVVDAPCLLDISSSTVDAFSKVAAGKATGPDLIPVDLLKAGSTPLCSTPLCLLLSRSW